MVRRGVAQLGRALPWGGRGRGFKSRRSDQFMSSVASLFLGEAFFTAHGNYAGMGLVFFGG